jgi:hypothetical protein
MLVLVGENRPICRSLTQTKWHFPVSRELEPFTLVMLASATRFRPIFTRLAAVLRRGRLGAGNGHYWTFRFYPSCARASIGRRSESGSRPAENVAQMSLRELKEEFKQTEGDPAIKGKMDQVRQVRRRRRMIAAVPKATVSTKE